MFNQRHNIKYIRDKVKNNEKFSCLAVYDSTMARICEENKIDVILVGDSLGQVIQGQENTLAVSIEDIAYHTKCINAGTNKIFIIADLPALSYIDYVSAAQNTKKLIQAGAMAIKIEYNLQHREVVKKLSSNGICVCAHIGILPQFINLHGNYIVQGKHNQKSKFHNNLQELKLLQESAIEDGAEIILYEGISAKSTNTLSSQTNLPTIGIGAGLSPNGQILVISDILGLNPKTPKFAHNFLQNCSIQEAINNYHQAVINKSFPTPKNYY